MDHVETVSHLAPHIRFGWGNTEGFVPYPGGGFDWGANGVGDDLFSYGFDGVSLWTGKMMFEASDCGLLSVEMLILWLTQNTSFHRLLF